MYQLIDEQFLTQQKSSGVPFIYLLCMGRQKVNVPCCSLKADSHFDMQEQETAG